MNTVSTSAFRVSTRELFYLTTFLCITLGMGAFAVDGKLLAVANGISLAVVVPFAGTRLYGWIIVGSMVVPLLAIILLRQLGGDAGEWSWIKPNVFFFICVGAASGAMLGLPASGKKSLQLLAASLFLFNFLWYLLSRVQ